MENLWYCTVISYYSFVHAIVPARPALNVCPLWIHGDGFIVSGMDWEQYSFAHPGASIAEFLKWSGRDFV